MTREEVIAPGDFGPVIDCKVCGMPIRWGLTEASKRIPVQARAVQIIQIGTGKSARGYESHFGFCDGYVKAKLESKKQPEPAT